MRARDAPGGPNRAQGASRNAPEGVRDAPKRKLYAAVAHHALGSTLATLFCRPRRFARTGRHAFRLSFNGVLTEFEEVRITRARAAWERAKRSLGHVKSRPGGRPSEQNRVRMAKFERKNGAGAQRGQQSAYFLATRTQQGATQSRAQPREERSAAGMREPRYENIRMDI